MCWHHDRDKTDCANAVSIPEAVVFDLLEGCLHEITDVFCMRSLTHGQLARLLTRIEVGEDRTVHIFWRKEENGSDCCGTNRNP